MSLNTTQISILQNEGVKAFCLGMDEKEIIDIFDNKYNPKRHVLTYNQNHYKIAIDDSVVTDAWLIWDYIDERITDTLMICKGWYNKNIYHNILEAMNAYYHKYYGCEDIIMDKALALHLFLQPLALKAIEKNPKLAKCLFEPSYSIMSNKEIFVDVMYDRVLGLIQMIEHGTFDLSEYNEMLARAEACNYEDETIGII